MRQPWEAIFKVAKAAQRQMLFVMPRPRAPSADHTTKILDPGPLSPPESGQLNRRAPVRAERYPADARPRATRNAGSGNWPAGPDHL